MSQSSYRATCQDGSKPLRAFNSWVSCRFSQYSWYPRALSRSLSEHASPRARQLLGRFGQCLSRSWQLLGPFAELPARVPSSLNPCRLLHLRSWGLPFHLLPPQGIEKRTNPRVPDSAANGDPPGPNLPHGDNSPGQHPVAGGIQRSDRRSQTMPRKKRGNRIRIERTH